MDIILRTQLAMRTAAIAHKGPYMEIGKTFRELFHWAKSAGAFIPDPPNGGPQWGIGIYYDNPMVTPPDELRSEACIVVPDGFEVSGSGVRELTIPSGTYAVTTFVGPYSELGTAWQEFMSHGLLQTSHHPDYDRPCMEFYIDDCNTVAAEELRTELLVPVKE